MPNQRNPDQVAVTFYVDRSLKAEAKKYTAMNGKTVTDVLVRALREYVRQERLKERRAQAAKRYVGETK